MPRPMDINQIIINMKTTDLFQSILLFALFLCGLTACYGTAKHRGPNEDITGELRCPWHRSSKPSQNKLTDYRDT